MVVDETLDFLFSWSSARGCEIRKKKKKKKKKKIPSILSILNHM